MICRLCLKDSTEVIQIFDVVGIELNVSIVLGKYFWFEVGVQNTFEIANKYISLNSQKTTIRSLRQYVTHVG